MQRPARREATKQGEKTVLSDLKGSPVSETPCRRAFRTWTRVDWAAPDCTPGRGARNRGGFRGNIPGVVIKIREQSHNRYSTSEEENHPRLTRPINTIGTLRYVKRITLVHLFLTFCQSAKTLARSSRQSYSSSGMHKAASLPRKARVRADV